MRSFGTFGSVYPDINYVVSRKDELADYVNRVKQGRYIVLFAPRQTGKTTFFRNALDALEADSDLYLPIHLNLRGMWTLMPINFIPHYAEKYVDKLQIY